MTFEKLERIIRTSDPKRQQAYLTIQKELDAEILRSLISTLNLQEKLIIYKYSQYVNMTEIKIEKKN